jgi:chromate transport protein ChrA
LAVRGVPALSDMGIFFTKAAFLTIGGAYAVLPYVYQGGVEHFGWLTGPQMMDGLALGEATPGPLIMVVTWVGYLGGVSKEVLANPVLAGIAGAAVATFFTFLPSFLFIGGGPLSRHRGSCTTGKLTATAAVVGVIVNLAVFFAWHLLPGATDAAPFAGPSMLRGPGRRRRLPRPLPLQDRHHEGHRRLRPGGACLHAPDLTSAPHHPPHCPPFETERYRCPTNRSPCPATRPG